MKTAIAVTFTIAALAAVGLWLATRSQADAAGTPGPQPSSLDLTDFPSDGRYF